MTRAQFVGGQVFWDAFCAFKSLWFRGRYGGGKTSFAFIMAARLLAEKRVNSIVSNIPCSFSTPPEVPFVHSGIVLDEAWIYLERRQDVMDYAAFVRKFDHYLLLPSIFPIHQRLTFFYVQRVFNAYTIGLPMWFYEWGIRDKVVKEKGTFAIYNPTSIYYHYPTNFVAGDDGGISHAVTETSKKKGFKGTRQQQQVINYAQQVKDPSIMDIEEKASGNAYDIEDALDDFSHGLDLSIADIEDAARKIAKAIRR